MKDQSMINRMKYAVENGNASRIVKWDIAKCEAVAIEALEATGYKSFKAAAQYLNSKRIAYSL